MPESLCTTFSLLKYQHLDKGLMWSDNNEITFEGTKMREFVSQSASFYLKKIIKVQNFKITTFYAVNLHFI